MAALNKDDAEIEAHGAAEGARAPERERDRESREAARKHLTDKAGSGRMWERSVRMLLDLAEQEGGVEEWKQVEVQEVQEAEVVAGRGDEDVSGGQGEGAVVGAGEGTGKGGRRRWRDFHVVMRGNPLVIGPL